MLPTATITYLLTTAPEATDPTGGQCISLLHHEESKSCVFRVNFPNKQKKCSFEFPFPFIYFEFLKNANHIITLNFGIIHLDLQE